VVSVKVSEGQAIKSGDLVAIIEAMKMENEVLAPRAGTVTQIVAGQGTAVKTGDPLVMLA
jgi:biotin carboxyl carrier protein